MFWGLRHRILGHNVMGIIADPSGCLKYLGILTIKSLAIDLLTTTGSAPCRSAGS